MAVKVTFTLDDATVERINRTAKRLQKPKSQIVREAIRQYESTSERMSDEEREYKLRVLREYVAHAPKRSQAEVDRELAELRAVRRLPGRLHPMD